MQGRTFFRIMLDNLFINNAFCKALIAVIKFCNEQNPLSRKTLKFSEKMPFTKTEQTYNYKTRFIFDSKQAYGVRSK